MQAISRDALRIFDSFGSYLRTRREGRVSSIGFLVSPRKVGQKTVLEKVTLRCARIQVPCAHDEKLINSEVTSLLHTY